MPFNNAGSGMRESSFFPYRLFMLRPEIGSISSAIWIMSCAVPYSPCSGANRLCRVKPECDLKCSMECLPSPARLVWLTIRPTVLPVKYFSGWAIKWSIPVRIIGLVTCFVKGCAEKSEKCGVPPLVTCNVFISWANGFSAQRAIAN